MSLDELTRTKITEIIQKNDVVVFMKGNRRAPACGFSAAVVQILDELVPSYATVDVLSDAALRDGIKVFSSWPTIPQLYVKGEFVGGCDIVREMHASGDLQKALGVRPPSPPEVRVSASAAQAFRDAAESESDMVHIEVGPRFEYGLFFGPRAAGDVEVQAGGVAFLFDAASARRVGTLSIDFIEGAGGGFKLESSNEPPKVKQIPATELKAMIDRGEAFELIDVRTEKERAIAKLDRARPLDEPTRRHLDGLDKETLLVFHCHHGGRSQAAAEHYITQGFRRVYNVVGGIDAWSSSVDPTVPRY